MSHELADKTASLASRVNNLAGHHRGSDRRALLEQQDRLAKLQLVAIVKDLSDEHADYQAAIKGLNDAIGFIGNAGGEIQDVAKAIKLASKAATLVDKAVKTVAA